MKVPFTWKVTGWFMVGWSAEFPIGEVRPLHYFGEDLVAYRDESGELHVLEAHCKHLGAHIGHGGTVVGDCVECPFHGWRWGPDGANRYIPYQPDRPNRGTHPAGVPGAGAVRLRVPLAPPRRQGTAVGDAGHLHLIPPVRNRPGRLLPAVSGVLQARRARTGTPADRGGKRTGQRPFPVRAPRHGDARMLDWNIVDQEWRFLTGWPDAGSDDPEKMALRIHSHMFGLGVAISAFEGSRTIG